MDIREKIASTLVYLLKLPEKYAGEVADEILTTIKEVDSNCWYCGHKADGPMLAMGNQMAHAKCVIRKLNELLDPDYEGKGEPDEVIGFKAGYVKLADGDRVICKTAWDLLSPVIQRGLDEEKRKAGWRK